VIKKIMFETFYWTIFISLFIGWLVGFNHGWEERGK